MKTIKTGIEWMDKVIPEGLPLKSTTVITGPGGSGKPLIGETFVAAWLKNGGSVIFMSLQYPGSEFIVESIKSVTGLDIQDYKGKIIFLQLDTEISGYQEIDKNHIRANLLKPEVWETVLNLASKKLSDEGPGILIFGSALNLLLFSPSYGDAIFEKIKSTMALNTDKTYLFSVSTSAKVKEIAQLEEIADNLLISRSEKSPFQLFMKVLKMKDVSFISDEVKVPISPEILSHIKEMADHSRSKVLPSILKT
jgi:KaiC/GvpD/RAD55 family RecA-like ATPase